MLTIHRQDLAENLAAYGEIEASRRIESMSDDDYRKVCEIGFRHALERVPLLQAACLAAVEVIEGKPRELKRSRRDWRDVQRTPRPPDAIADSVTARIERYAGGRPVKSAEILDHLTKIVGANLKDFTWVKSRRTFYSRFSEGTSYVGLDCKRSTVALSFGVRHELIEERLARLCPEEKSKLHAHRLTVWKYSYNMGPLSPRWRYPSETTWPILGYDGLALATPEIVAFVKDIAEPYALRHRDPLAIRNTLLFLPGHTDHNTFEALTVFAVDHLARRRDWLDEDYERLSVSFAARDAELQKRGSSLPNPALGIILAIPKVFAPTHWRDQLKHTYDRVAERWDA